MEESMERAQGPIVFLTPGSLDSLAALAGLAEFASALDRPLTVLHLLGASGQAPDRRVAEAIAALPSSSPAPDTFAVPADDIHTALATIAKATGGLLALLPKRPRSIDRFLVGNEYERLLRNGPLPVLALPAYGRIARPSRVLFPADLSPRSAAAFDEAVAVCRTVAAELHLLHVFGDDRLLPSEVDQARRAVAQSPRELLSIDQEQLSALVAKAAAQGVRASWQTAEGRAHDQILGYTAASAIDLIVMPSHGPRSVEDILRGSTTVRVVQKSPVAVLAMRA
jgi:nucleotide-binding universal stress UspA family protein